jgi:hypothetical protein
MAIGRYIPTSALARPGVCTSTTRPASPYEGQAIYETDTDKTYIWNGSLWVEQLSTTVIDAKGDLIVGTAADTASRLAVGNNGYAVVADPNSAAGLNYSPLTGFRNSIVNGGFEVWQRGVGSISASAGALVFLPDRWFVFASGAAITIARSTSAPSGGRSRYSYQITGATSVTTVNVGQRIEASFMPAIKQTVTFSARIYNNTGSLFTPVLNLFTPATEDGFSSVTQRLSQSLQSCANGAWTTVSHTVDISGYTNINNGLSLEIQFPSGSLNAGTKSVTLTEVQLEPGPVATPFEVRPLQVEIALCQRYYEKSYDIGTAPNANTNNGLHFFSGSSDNNGQVYVPIQFKVEKRSTNYSVAFNVNTGASSGNWAYGRSGAAANTAMAANYKGTKGFNATTGNIGVGWVVAQVLGHWVADAEL